ncbi:hypothetical protein [Aristaeella lactis]|uniref:Uncharacterized protein n=1 Tax=Aristaeella lactis TaxID=3046383 RepID=A0AC61PI32_9FIRM|nr:hypothetical protein [Aristaeella lactis]QUA53628.1 hypothetical protein JYE50_03060 [Aristaeella lactis]SMC37819.1 hypothetical protein SAMN06297397_0410 [Aristaeella lactis]
MDIQKIISDLVSKLTGNKDLIAKFTADPLKAIKDLLGIDLDPSQLGDVVKGVTGQLGDITGDAAKQAGGILSKLKSIFGRK